MEKSTDNSTDYSWHMSKVRFIEYVEYYYDDIKCRGDGIPKLIKLWELMGQLPDTNHGVKNGWNSINRIGHKREDWKKSLSGLKDLVY